MSYATRGDQTLRATSRDFVYYLLRDLRDPVDESLDFEGGLIPIDGSYFSGRAAGGDSNPCERDYVLTQYLLLFVTATFLLGEYFPPVAILALSHCAVLRVPLPSDLLKRVISLCSQF